MPRCRRARAAPFASNLLAACGSTVFVRGEDRLRRYKLPGAKHFTQVFCELCSSPMPRRDEARGIDIVPMGGLDDDPGIKPCDHIYTDFKAEWHEITGGLPQFPAMPA